MGEFFTAARREKDCPDGVPFSGCEYGFSDLTAIGDSHQWNFESIKGPLRRLGFSCLNGLFIGRDCFEPVQHPHAHSLTADFLPCCVKNPCNPHTLRY